MVVAVVETSVVLVGSRVEAPKGAESTGRVEVLEAQVVWEAAGMVVAQRAMVGFLGGLPVAVVDAVVVAAAVAMPAASAGRPVAMENSAEVVSVELVAVVAMVAIPAAPAEMVA